MSNALEINLNIKKEKEQLNELYWGEAPNPYALGDSIKIVLTKMFGMGGPNVHVKGTAAPRCRRPCRVAALSAESSWKTIVLLHAR